MKIAVPTEIKPREGRVALVPDAVAQLISHGHEVFIQAGAGLLSGYSNEQYELQGAQILPDAEAIYKKGKLDSVN